MWIQRMTWILGRIIFYTLLVLSMGTVIYNLSYDKWLGALISGCIFIIVLYKGLICLKIRAYSIVVQDGRVVFFIPEATVRNRFDFVTRGQTIVELPQYGLLDRPYKLEIICPDDEVRVHSCRLSFSLEYLLEPEHLQAAYDCFVMYQEKMVWEVRKVLLKSGSGLVSPQAALVGDEAMKDYLKPVVEIFNHGLKDVGMKIKEATCSFTSGTKLVRFVATEQELLEKVIG